MSQQTQPSKGEELANEIAKEFREEEQVNLYQHICQQYDDAVVRSAFADAMKVPSEKIKKSRSALFFYLLKTNGKK